MLSLASSIGVESFTYLGLGHPRWSPGQDGIKPQLHHGDSCVSDKALCSRRGSLREETKVRHRASNASAHWEMSPEIRHALHGRGLPMKAAVTAHISWSLSAKGADLKPCAISDMQIPARQMRICQKCFLKRTQSYSCWSL